MKLHIDLNLYEQQKDHCHGRADKDLIVLHETVSKNYTGLADIKAISNYLAEKDYGIHGITDDDGNIAWSLGAGTCVFWHTASQGTKGTGMVNTRGIGIEQISRVMLDYKSNTDRLAAWLHMDKELNATAKLVATIARVHDIPLVVSDGSKPGVTTHWLVTEKFGVVGGHSDCWPTGVYGGYYPLNTVLTLAKRYYKLGYVF